MDHFLADIDEAWTLFLDRDGVLNQKLEGDYVKSLSEFDILPGVMEAMYKLNSQFLHIVVVTNQQGIGKGLMTEESLQRIHSYLNSEVANAQGRIDAIYYCPHLSEVQCSCRKPHPGMAIRAKQDFPDIDFQKSIMVGDSNTDMEFGRNLGMKTVFCAEKSEKSAFIDLNTASLLQFAQLLESYKS